MTTADEHQITAELHPSDIGGVTDEYRAFLQTWAAHCGAPKSVFEGNLNLVIQAELRAAGRDVVQYALGLQKQVARTGRALDGLTADLIAFLSTHDCVLLDHVGDGCPDGELLIGRLKKARTVLGFVEPEAVA